jgi:F-type H+-transporting ATPase subunit b
MTFLAFAENSIQLVPDGTLLLHIAIILVMVFVLNATLFKPINRILEEREKRTRGRTGEARDILQRVEEKMAQYEHSLREARSEGYRLMEQERATAMSERQAKLGVVREEINRSMTEQKQAISGQVEEARATLESDARRLAAEIGAQILDRPISDSVTSSVSLGA